MGGLEATLRAKIGTPKGGKESPQKGRFCFPSSSLGEDRELLHELGVANPDRPSKELLKVFLEIQDAPKKQL